MTPTKEEMLKWTCKAHAVFPDDINIIYAIRDLIENRPKVSRAWIRELAVNLIIAVPKVKGSCLKMSALHEMVEKEIRGVIREAGVEVEE
jgi:vacuolar-type H+-ATPase subunit F/Vma7